MPLVGLLELLRHDARNHKHIKKKYLKLFAPNTFRPCAFPIFRGLSHFQEGLYNVNTVMTLHTKKYVTCLDSEDFLDTEIRSLTDVHC